MKYMKAIAFKLIQYTLTLIFVGITVSCALQVIFRYFINQPLSWTEELSRYLMVWLTFIGGAVAFYYKYHLGVDFFVSKLPVKVANFISVFVNLVIGWFLILIIKDGIKVSISNMIQTSPAMQIPMGIVYVAIPIGSLLMLFVVIREIVTVFKHPDQQKLTQTNSNL